MRDITDIEIICSSLFSAAGHEYFYTKQLIETAARRGIAAHVALPRGSTVSFDVPHSKHIRPRESPAHYPQRLRQFVVSRRAKILTAQVAAAKPGALILVHTAGISDLRVVAYAARTYGHPAAVIVRYDHYDDPTSIDALRDVARSGAALITDSQDLADAFQTLTGKPFAVSGPPVVTTELSRNENEGSAVRVGFFGGARPGKGFLELPRIMRLVRDTLGADTEMFVQAYSHPDDRAIESAIAAARADLHTMEGMTLCTDVMEPARYNQAMQDCDIIVLPYDPELYRSVTSGIFVEALARGKIVLVPEGSWMANEAARFKLDRCEIIDFSSDDQIRDAIAQAVKRRNQPSQAVTRWSETHTYDALLDTILNTTRLAAKS